ncbi:hypothetical protein CTI12_AA404220 [Artemisia annua]|uniref:rRNA-processing protein EFG1 n=1 Tax=Artemisia annua TaxID=35608 RepID=A0A2U1M940_ARTAN|nr:hypothetical protein CTI12_AA404220 [Artemisia annua]
MEHRRLAGRKPVNNNNNNRPKSSSLGVSSDNNRKPKAAKIVTLKRQIRSTERMIRKDTRAEVKEALTKKLEALKNQQQALDNLALERKIFLRDRKIKFFERRKVERQIRRLEKQQRASSGQAQETEIAEQLSKLKEDLEYIRFFPKTEKYVSLFKKGDTTEIVDKRNSLRTQIKENIAAATLGDNPPLPGCIIDDQEPSNTHIKCFCSIAHMHLQKEGNRTPERHLEQASSASGKAASGMSSDERNQRHVSARTLMPPPRASNVSSEVHAKPRYTNSYHKNSSSSRAYLSSSSNTSTSYERPSYKNRKPLDTRTHTGNSSTHAGNSSTHAGNSSSHMGNSSSNLSSNSDARKPKRKRRPKKKKQ